MNINPNQLYANKITENMFNETDLHFINEFIDENKYEIPENKANNYRKYKEDNKSQLSINNEIKSKLSINDNVPDNVSDNVDNRIITTDYTVSKNISFEYRKRKIFIDSQFRDKLLYPDASDFVTSWGRSFNNVVSIKLNSLEFPNVSQVVSSNVNNKLYWTNLEDNDLSTPFPVYSAIITPGSYTLATLQTEIQARTNSIKRHIGEVTIDGLVAPFHYFIMDISTDTDYVSFVSITTAASPLNPIISVAGNTLVTYVHQSHGFINGETAHIIGVRGIIGGLQSSYFNGGFIVQNATTDTFQFEVSLTASGTQAGGGSLVRLGTETNFQFLFGNYSDSIADNIGLRIENTAVDVIAINPISTTIINIVDVIPGPRTLIVAPNHNLSEGDVIYIYNVETYPSLYNNEIFQGTFTVVSIPSPDTFYIGFHTLNVMNITDAYIGTRIFTMNYENHGFNRIVDIEQIAANQVQITTLFNHNLSNIDSIRLSNTNSFPSVDGFYKKEQITIVSSDSFIISNILSPVTPDVLPITITLPGYQGILASDYTFYLYNVEAFGGFEKLLLNSKPFTVRYISSQNSFTFTGLYGFSTSQVFGGGSNIRINSKLHGWSKNINNSPNGILNKPVKLASDNYAFICIPDLPVQSIATNGPVQNIFAKIFITANPGIVMFSSFDSTEIDFLDPIPTFSQLRFTIKSPTNITTSFNGIDYSLGMEVTELIPKDNSKPLLLPNEGHLAN